MELQSLRQEAEELRKKIKVNGGPMHGDRTRPIGQIRRSMSCYSCAIPRCVEESGVKQCALLPFPPPVWFAGGPRNRASCWVLFVGQLGLIENGRGSFEFRVTSFTFVALLRVNGP